MVHRPLSIGWGLQQGFVFEGELQELVVSFELELLTNVGPMVLDSTEADVKLLGDFLTGLIFRDQSKYLPFSGAQTAQGRRAFRPLCPEDEVIGHCRAHIVLPDGNGS